MRYTSVSSSTGPACAARVRSASRSTSPHRRTSALVIEENGTTKAAEIPGAPADLMASFMAGDGSTSNVFTGAGVTQLLPQVSFYPDGTCTPFHLLIKTALLTQQFNIDPWTCARMLPPLNPDGTPVATR